MASDVLTWVFNIGDQLAGDLARGESVRSPKMGRAGLVAYQRKDDSVVLAANWGYRPGCIRGEVCSTPLEVDEEVQLFGGTIESYLMDYGFGINSSPSGVAFALLKQRIIDQELEHDDTLHHWRWTRSAYKGGLSCVVKTWFDLPTAKIDRNSAYPHRMLSPLPASFARRSTTIEPGGLYRARVFIRDMQIPFLQSHTWTGSIAYPVGRLTDTWTGNELLYAESQGVRIERVFGGRLPTREIDVSEAVQRLLKARKEIPAPFNAWCKQAVNSMAGLLGRREYVSVYKIGQIPRGWRAAPTGNLDVDIGTTEVLSLSKYSMPGTASHITADSRIALHQKAAEIGFDNCFYFDTDSIAFDADRLASVTDIGPSVGQWKLEKVALTYKCDKLRRISWDHSCAPTSIAGGNYLCGRLVAGTYTVPATIRECLLAERRTQNDTTKNASVQGYAAQGRGPAPCGNDVELPPGGDSGDQVEG